MDISIEEGKEYNNIEIIIHCPIKDQNVDKIVSLLEYDEMKLECKKNQAIYHIDIADIYYVETIDEKTFVYKQNDYFEVPKRLYELVEKLNTYKFIQISKSCLLNLDYLDHIKALFNGKYEATLVNQEKLIISRKYMSDFRSVFNMI